MSDFTQTVVPSHFPSEPPVLAPLLAVRKLAVDVRQGLRRVRVLDDVSMIVGRGEAVALAGDSGAGKSMMACAIMRLFPGEAGRIAEGQVLLEGTDLVRLTHAQLREVRGSRIGMVFQDGPSFLDPSMPVGRQIAETLLAHGHTVAVESRVHELLEMLELPQPWRLARMYPHELPRDVQQCVLIAAALALRPDLLILDEPAALLDARTRARLWRVLAALRQDTGMGLLLLTQDLHAALDHCQRVNVMYAGEIVETTSSQSLREEPRHPCTQGLLRSRPRPLFFMPGAMPPPGRWPTGCRFHPRCPISQPGLCDVSPPYLEPRGLGADRCHLSEHARARDAWGEA